MYFDITEFLWFFCFCFLFCGTGVLTQEFVIARQMFYPLSHASSHFCLVILEIGPYFLPKLAWTVIFLF
jgi:hypothetical protein